jgi:hypothetical protein
MKPTDITKVQLRSLQLNVSGEIPLKKITQVFDKNTKKRLCVQNEDLSLIGEAERSLSLKLLAGYY